MTSARVNSDYIMNFIFIAQRISSKINYLSNEDVQRFFRKLIGKTNAVQNTSQTTVYSPESKISKATFRVLVSLRISTTRY